MTLSSRLHRAQLYGILDLGYVDRQAVAETTRALCEGGIDLIQLRAKTHSPSEIEAMALVMLPITRNLGVPLIINDHPIVAATVGSEGVHIGQDDLPVETVRQLVGADCWIGKSTHSSAQAFASADEDVDYLGFGPLFATGTKPDYTPIGLQDIATVQTAVSQPVFCIGGVNPARLETILAAGARRVVIVSAFLQAHDIRAEVKAVKTRLAQET